jgi:hypothetical protein
MRKIWLELICAASAPMILIGASGYAEAAAGAQIVQHVTPPAVLEHVQYREDYVYSSEAEPTVVYEGRRLDRSTSRYVPPVYGYYFVERPSSCGEFRYWDGESCVDARDNPPSVVPRW